MINDTRCPNCELLNLPTATACLKCKTPFSGLPPTKKIILPPTVDYSQPQPPEHYREQIHISNQQPMPFASQFSSAISQNNATGRRTHFWYRVYCSLLTVIYIAFAIFGVLGIIASYGEAGKESSDAFLGGMMFVIFGTVFGIMFLIGVVLPTKPYSWIYGIILIAVGMTSCIFIPLMVPLLIFWMKPETQAFFERK